MTALVMLMLVVPVQARQAAELVPTGLRTIQWLRQATPNASTTFIIGLRDDGAQTQADQASAIAARHERRARVHQVLSARANRNEAALRAFLKSSGLSGEVSALTPFQTFNGFSLTATGRVVEALRRWERVSSVDLEEQIQLEMPKVGTTEAQINAIEWNISKIGADRVQSELGITGAGVIVGGLDTGVRATHTALSANYKCAGIAHTACWKDALNNQAAPYDDNGHGTHTMGTAVGSGGIGVAPGAKWIACKAFSSSGSGSQTAILACFDWFLAPGGSTANAPDVVNNSWGSNAGSSTTYQQAVTNWVNAGIYPAFSNGNNGAAGCGSVGSPASYTNAVGTGATNSTDTIASFSSRGPSPFGVIKPDLSAPGVNIRSAWGTSDTGYNTISGTSMAAPHLTGLVALLLQANSSLTINQLTANLKANALGISVTNQCSSSGVPNNLYGWGRIRAYESVQAARGGATSPAAGSRLWLRADVGVTSSAGKVSVWADQSGNNNHATMATAARQPSLVSGALNGQPVLRFGGAQSLALSTPVSPQSFTIFVVGKNSQSTETFSMILGPGDSSPNNQLRWENGTQALLVGVGNNLPTTVSTIGNTRVYHALSVRYNGSTLTVYRDGNLVSSHAFTTSGPWTLAQVGAWFSSYFLVGDLAEILIYPTALSETDRTVTNSYLKSKYALP